MAEIAAKYDCLRLFRVRFQESLKLLIATARVSTTVATRQTKAGSLLPAASGPTDTAQVAGAGAARATTVLVAFFFPSEVQLAPPPWALSRLETRPNGLSNDHSFKQQCETAQNALEIACFTPGQSPA